MTWGPTIPLPDDLSFDQAQLAAALGNAGGGGRWRGHQVFADLPNVGVVEQTIQNQGSTTVLPTAAGIVTLVGGATDVVGSGTGAWVVQIRGLGADYVGSPNPDEAWLDDFVPMNGATPVESNVPFLRVFEIRVVVAGTSETNEGTITATVGGNLQVQIDPLRTLSRSTHVAVPRGWTGFTDFFNINWVAVQPVRMQCFVRLDGVVFPGFRVTFPASADFEIGVTAFPETSDLWCSALRIGGGGTDALDVTLPFIVHRNK